METKTIAAWRKETAKKLCEHLSAVLQEYDYNAAVLDTDVLLTAALHRERGWILAHGENSLPDNVRLLLNEQITARLSGKPIAYILKQKEFFGLPFFVDERVLIPKCDTEILVERALTFCESFFAHSSTMRILDVCSGSGCIGIALAKNLCAKFLDDKTAREKKVELFFQDISKATLETAKRNADALLKREQEAGLLHASFICKDLRDGLEDSTDPASAGGYDCIVANPPYVPEKIATALLEDGRSEPLLALAGGTDGLALFPALAAKVYRALKTNGAFYIEAGEYNIARAAVIFKKAGFRTIAFDTDLAGDMRIFYGVKADTTKDVLK